MRYDVAVVGGGPGGYVAAISAAQHGLSTVLIERDKVGGTCLNRGCIPTKALLYCSEQFEQAKQAHRFGVKLNVEGMDYSVAYNHKQDVVNKLCRGVASLVKGNGAEYINANATLTGAHTLMAGEKEIEFTNLIIATGSKPAPAPFEVSDGANVIDSDGFLELSQLPESVLIAGGGVIGVEFATILANLGKTVIIAEAMEQILPNMDSELALFTQKKLEAKGVRFVLSSFVTGAKGVDGNTVCTIKTGENIEEITVDTVVCAIGRRSCFDSLSPESAGVTVGKRGIPVDEYCRTNVPHIYAIGDVNGRCMLAHAASAQGKTVVESIVSKKNIECDFDIIPSCVYTDPEIASVGLSKEQALKKGYTVKCGYFDATGNGKLMTAGKNEGFFKIVSDQTTGEILGAQICSDRATDMIAEIALAMKLESTVLELTETIHPHPTVSEAVMEAADDCISKCVHKIYR